MVAIVVVDTINVILNMNFLIYMIVVIIVVVIMDGKKTHTRGYPRIKSDKGI